MTYKVSVATNSYTVKFKSSPKYKVSVNLGGVQVPAQFSDLQDFNPSGLQDKYLIMYDATTQKYITVDPDVILTNATSGGLPATFVNQLDVDLDNKIDLDGGTF